MGARGLPSGLHQSCSAPQGPPSITTTDVLLTRQMPRPDPRQGNLHFQQASQLNLKHMKGRELQTRSCRIPWGTTTDIRIPLLGVTWQTQPQSPKQILYRTGLEAAGSRAYKYDDTERLMRNIQKVGRKSWKTCCTRIQSRKFKPHIFGKCIPS